jgi:hypothetical protein
VIGLEEYNPSQRLNTVEDKEYVNPFTDVHENAKAFRDRVREANRNETELRESRLVQVKEALDKKHD